MSGQQPGGLDGALHGELLFLVLHHLSGIPALTGAARQLEAALQSAQLLPSRVDVLGGVHAGSYSQMRAQHADLPHTALQQLLQQLLFAKQQDAQPGSQGVQTLLGPGRHSCLAACQESPLVAAWLRAPHAEASMPRKLLLREWGATGLPRGLTSSPQLVTSHLRHLRTFRGHRNAVYCITFDKSGRRVVTGSDDKTVKIWSAQTGLLLKTCRGHEAEITDLAISCDNALAASSCRDRQIRIWSLQDNNLGYPIAVLAGHTSEVSFLDFHSHLPSALLSSSFDGTCRIWDASDDSARQPLVLRPGLSFGAGTVHTAQPSTRGAMTGGTIAAAAPGGGGTGPLVAFMCCAFSPDGNFIVAGGSDCNAYVWSWLWQTVHTTQSGSGKAGMLQVFSTGVSVQPVMTGTQDASGRIAQPLAEAEVGASDHCAATAPSSDSGVLHDVAAESAGPPVSVVAATTSAVEWPQPHEVSKLVGHKNDINFIEFAHGGHAVATAAKDGSVRIWRQGGQPGAWTDAWAEVLVLACPPDEEDISKVRVRRRPPQPIAINQVVWSSDDRKVIAAVTDNSVRVWDAMTGAAQHVLRGHTQQAHVLESHPFDPRMAMSAGYDGITIVWDIQAGIPLKHFDSMDTCPVPQGRWADPLRLVDGHFSPDGSMLVVSDVSGQQHLYSTGCDSLLMAAPYDQFLSSDYDPVVRDVNSYVMDAQSQLPPHLMTNQLLCDFFTTPYSEEIQVAYQANRLAGDAVLRAAAMAARDSLPLPHALDEYPPTILSAEWQAVEAGGGPLARQTAVDRARLRHRQAMDALAAQMLSRVAAVAGQPQGASASHPRPASLNQQSGLHQHIQTAEDGDVEDIFPVEGISSEVEEYVDPGGGSSSGGHDTDEDDYELEDEDAEAGRSCAAPGHSAGGTGRRRRSARGRSRRSLRSSQGAHGSSEEEGVDSEGGGEGRRQGRPRAGGRGARGRSRRSGRLGARTQQPFAHRFSHDEAVGMELDGPGIAAGDGDVEEEEANSTSSGDDGGDDQGDQAGGAAGSRRAARLSRNSQQRAGSVARRGGGPRRGRGAAAAADNSEADQAAGTADEILEDTAAAAQQATLGRANGRPNGGSSTAARSLDKYQWLQVTSQAPDCYTPQLGDEVVYLPQGHLQLLEATQDKRTPRPWLRSFLATALCAGNSANLSEQEEGHEVPLQGPDVGASMLGQSPDVVVMTSAELCRVEALQYCLADDGSRSTVARLSLRLLHGHGPAAGLCFDVLLPAPPGGHADFVVLRSRYEAACARRWSCGERCKIYQVGLGGGGAWWIGTVVEDRLPLGLTNTAIWEAPHSSRALNCTAGMSTGMAATTPSVSTAAPSTSTATVVCSEVQPLQFAGVVGEVQGLWERYSVRWGGQLDDEALDLPLWQVAPEDGAEAEINQLSPWELLPIEVSWYQVLASDPHLDTRQQAVAEAALDAVLVATSHSPWRFQAFAKIIAASKVFVCRAQGGACIAYNAVVPLPLSLEQVQDRLASSYYRSLDAIRHDMRTIALNAALFNGAKCEITADITALCKLFEAVLDGVHGTCLADFDDLHVAVPRHNRSSAQRRLPRHSLTLLSGFVSQPTLIDGSSVADTAAEIDVHLTLPRHGRPRIRAAGRAAQAPATSARAPPQPSPRVQRKSNKRPRTSDSEDGGELEAEMEAELEGLEDSDSDDGRRKPKRQVFAAAAAVVDTATVDGSDSDYADAETTGAARPSRGRSRKGGRNSARRGGWQDSGSSDEESAKPAATRRSARSQQHQRLGPGRLHPEDDDEQQQQQRTPSGRPQRTRGRSKVMLEAMEAEQQDDDLEAHAGLPDAVVLPVQGLLGPVDDPDEASLDDYDYKAAMHEHQQPEQPLPVVAEWQQQLGLHMPVPNEQQDLPRPWQEGHSSQPAAGTPANGALGRIRLRARGQSKKASENEQDTYEASDDSEGHADACSDSDSDGAPKRRHAPKRSVKAPPQPLAHSRRTMRSSPAADAGTRSRPQRAAALAGVAAATAAAAAGECNDDDDDDGDGGRSLDVIRGRRVHSVAPVTAANGSGSSQISGAGPSTGVGVAGSKPTGRLKISLRKLNA